MILLEPGNRILEETVASQIRGGEKREAVDVRLCDFDDVSYRITVDKDAMDVMKVSMNLPCYYQTDKLGAEAALQNTYKDHIVDAEVGFSLTLAVKLNEVKDEDKDALIKNLSLIKSNITGGVFDYFFSALLADEKKEQFKFDLRGDTTVYFCPRDDRVTIVFSVDFVEHVDKVIAKVFLQEFVDARKKIGRAPPCQWGEKPPTELADFGVTENQGNLGYISFAILKSHVDKGKKESVIQVLQTFRTFLQYHIKCSKSHFHSKMRHRVRELQKVLNRAKVEEQKKEKKTAAGKTFKRS
jgi:actin related protein 2/3 complex subunit 2